MPLLRPLLLLRRLIAALERSRPLRYALGAMLVAPQSNETRDAFGGARSSSAPAIGTATTAAWAPPFDHALTWARPSEIAARGPCESEGCARRDRCPIFHRNVSDHCPITIDLDLNAARR